MKLSRGLWSIDIETVRGDSNAISEWIVNSTEVKTGNLKDPEKIKAKQDDVITKELSQAGLYWWTGKIICVSLENVVTGKVATFAGIDEAKLLGELSDFLSTTMISLVAQNGKSFDYPYLVGRYLANNIACPTVLRMNEKYDVLDLFGFSSMSQQRTSLSNIAFALGIKGKTSHGSKVQGMYDEAILGNGERWNDIKKYCEHDAYIVAEICRRYFGKTQVELLEAMPSAPRFNINDHNL